MANKQRRKLAVIPFTIGRNAFARISAVEGIQTTAAMNADFAAFDRKQLSAKQRRKSLSAKYGKRA